MGHHRGWPPGPHNRRVIHLHAVSSWARAQDQLERAIHHSRRLGAPKTPRWTIRQHTGDVRITIKVRPGSARPGLGGEHDGALVVRVSARAVDGKATEAALAAVADAFGVRRHAVTLVAGPASRMKIVDVADGDPA